MARVANDGSYKPQDTQNLAKTIRELFGSRDTIGHLRISNRAIEFDLFVENPNELESRRRTLESRIGPILTLTPLDLPPKPKPKIDILREGIRLFNEERFWECHEVLEQIWHPAKGTERDIIQGLILTAAALVHAQKYENNTTLTMLKKALSKLGNTEQYEGIDLTIVREKINQMLDSRNPQAFKIKL